MTSDQRLSVASPSLPARSGGLRPFGPPPLIGDEEGAAYDELLARVSGAVKPCDFIEQIWVGDVVDLVWEILRLRRLKAGLMRAAANEGLGQVLTPLLDGPERRGLVRDWVLRDPDAVKEVDELLGSAGLDMDVVMAATLSLKFDDVERMERMIAIAETRRNVALQEVESRRAALARSLRRVTQEAEDAEFKEIA